MKVFILTGISADKKINIIKVFDDLDAAEKFKNKYENHIKNNPFDELSPSVYCFIVERKLLD